jgi:hypothetical protein
VFSSETSKARENVIVIRPRARHFRIVVQTIFLFAFVALFWGLAEPRVPSTVASILLALDPLTAVGTALSDWTIVGWTWIGLASLSAVVFDQIHRSPGTPGVGCPGNEPRRLARSNPAAPSSFRLRHPPPMARRPFTRRLGILWFARGDPLAVSVDATVFLPRRVSTWCPYGSFCAIRAVQDPA